MNAAICCGKRINTTTTTTAAQSSTLLSRLPRTEHCFARRCCPNPTPSRTIERPISQGRSIVKNALAVPVEGRGKPEWQATTDRRDRTEDRCQRCRDACRLFHCRFPSPLQTPRSMGERECRRRCKPSCQHSQKQARSYSCSTSDDQKRRQVDSRSNEKHCSNQSEWGPTQE